MLHQEKQYLRDVCHIIRFVQLADDREYRLNYILINFANMLGFHNFVLVARRPDDIPKL